MNLPFFVSKRISKPHEGSFSSTIHKIAIASVGLSLGTMILSFAILEGFQGVISNKMVSFSSHLTVTRFTFGNKYSEDPISINRAIYKNPEQYDFIDHVQLYSFKPGLMKNQEIMGMMLKGVGADFDRERFKSNLIAGDFIEFPESGNSNDIVISKITAAKLQLDTGDLVAVHFFQDPPRVRRLKVKGIYETWIEEFDKKIALVDINLIRRLNNWPDSIAGGFEIFIKDFKSLDQAESILYDEIDSDLYVQSIKNRHREVFDWLDLIRQNMYIFLGLVMFVACFNMVSIVFILIMERTQMIGLFKALGATNQLIRRVFTYNGMIIIGRGLLFGNLFGLGLAFLQDQFRLIRLDPENYYMSYVPIEWNWPIILILNLAAFLMISMVLAIPTTIISRIQPIKSMKFD